VSLLQMAHEFISQEHFDHTTLDSVPKRSAKINGSGVRDAVPQPEVHVPGLGTLQGTSTSISLQSGLSATVYSFLGVPYAKPPLGDLRWRPPQAHGPWESPRDASRSGKMCMQPSYEYYYPEDPYMMSEDCLFLNVHTPHRTEILSENEK
jgi:hypothetical protein